MLISILLYLFLILVYSLDFEAIDNKKNSKTFIIVNDLSIFGDTLNLRFHPTNIVNISKQVCQHYVALDIMQRNMFETCFLDVAKHLNSIAKLDSEQNKEIQSIELILRLLEKERFNEIQVELKNRDISIRGFYHTSTYRRYFEDVIREQIWLLDGKRKRVESYSHDENISVHWENISQWTSAIEIMDNLILNVASIVNKDFSTIPNLADYTLTQKHRELLYSLASNKQISNSEYSTMNMLRQYCFQQVSQHKTAFVLYFHSKGSCCYKGAIDGSSSTNMPVIDWRDMMNSFIIEFPSICIRALLDGYSTCGTSYNSDYKGYEGNFWWSTCDHIVKTGDIDPFDVKNREKMLFNISNDINEIDKFSNICSYEAFNCNVANQYRDRCPRSKYRYDIFDKIIQKELSLERSKINDVLLRKKVCN